MEIEEFHQMLNREDLIPPFCYRRDKSNYSLTSYVNNIIGCYLSGNLKPITIFIERARFYIEDNPANSETENYYKLVSSYLQKMELILEASST